MGAGRARRQRELRRAPAPGPRLHVRGLGLLLAGCADTASLRRAGLLDGDPDGASGALDGLAGRPPELVDYF